MTATEKDSIELSLEEQDVLLTLINVGDTLAEKMARDPFAKPLSDEWRRLISQIRPAIARMRLKTS